MATAADPRERLHYPDEFVVESPDGANPVVEDPVLPAAEERPLWQSIAALYVVIVLMIVLFITAAFVIAYFLTGSAY